MSIVAQVLQKKVSHNSNFEFANFILPEANQLLQLAEDTIEGHDSFGRLLCELFLTDGLEICLKTLVLEMHLARNDGRIKGGDSANRYRQFLSLLCDPEARARIHNKYPELERLLKVCQRRTLEFVTEVFRHYCKDQENLTRHFGFSHTPARIESTGSDSHRGGRRVLLFEDSKGQKLIYKPRSLELDLAFHEFLKWIHRQDSRFNLKGFDIFNEQDHGWTAFVSHAPAADESEIRQFYYNFGVLQGIIYCLVGVDFHFENVIAHKSWPVLVDLEGLLHPRIDHLVGNRRSVEAIPSVSQSGLLPIFLWGVNSDTRIDVSAIGHSGRGRALMRNPSWVGKGTDQMRIAEVETLLKPGMNRPLLNGEEVSPSLYHREVLAGFSDFYQFCLENKTAITDFNNGPLAKLLSQRTRCILKPTSYYQKLLETSTHPNLLVSTGRRRQYFNCVTEATPAYFGGAAASEIQDLMEFDVPLFYGSPRVQTIRDSRGVTVPNLAPGAAAGQVERRFTGKMCPADLARNLWFISTSLKIVRAKEEGRGNPKGVDAPRPQPLTMAQVRRAEQRVAERMAILHGPNTASFLTVCKGKGQEAIREVTPSFYFGQAGAVFAADQSKVAEELRSKLRRGPHVQWRLNRAGRLVDKLVRRIPVTKPTTGDVSLATGCAGQVILAIRARDGQAFKQSLEILVGLIEREDGRMFGSYGDIEVCSFANGWAGVLWTLSLAGNFLLEDKGAPVF